MPTTVISSKVRPTYEEKPDVRFATSFLDHKYRDYSVTGEAIMDKTTGELFLKRSDGRIISFEQNKKYLHDLALELRVLLNNNSDFYYPSDSYSAYFVQSHFDLVTINDEHQTDLYATAFEPTVIPNDDESILHHLEFNVSNQTNGIFIRLNTRDSDKVLIEFFTNLYNKTIDTYAGTSQTILAEKEKMDAIELWRDSNVQLDYTVIVTDAFTTQEYEKTTYIRYNESCSVYLPVGEINTDFPYGYNNIKVRVNKLSYPKLRFVVMHPTLFGSEYEDQVEKFIAPDKFVMNQYLTAMYFVNKAEDIEILGNEQVVALLDGPYIRRYMMKMSKLLNSSSIIFSVDRPSDDLWGTNSLWAEHVRDVMEDGVEEWMGSETDIRRLEGYFSKTHKKKYQHIGIFVTDEDDDRNFFVKEVEDAGGEEDEG